MYYLRVLCLYTRLHIIIVYNNNTTCYIPSVCFSVNYIIVMGERSIFRIGVTVRRRRRSRHIGLDWKIFIFIFCYYLRGRCCTK